MEANAASKTGRGLAIRRAAAGLIVLALVLLTPTVARAAGSISLSPAKGPPGSSFTVNGSGFAPGLVAIILWDGLQLVQLTVDLDGEFSVGATVPGGAAGGPHTVTALVGADSATARFIVQTDETTTTTSPTTTTTTTSTTTTTAPTTTTTAPTTTTMAPTTTTTTTAPTATTTSPTTTTTAPATTTSPSTSTTPTTGTDSSTTTTDDPPEGSSTTTDPDVTGDETTTTAPGTTGTSEPGEGGDGPPEQSTTAITLPFTGGDDAATPELEGQTIEVGQFSISPISGVAGSSISVEVHLNEAIPGLSSMQLEFDGEALGGPVAIDGEEISLRRVVPEVDPGTYEIRVVSGDLVLARSSFEVLESDPVVGTISATTPVIGLLAVAVLGLGWQAVRTIRNSTPYGPSTGLVPGWRHFRRWLANVREHLPIPGLASGWDHFRHWMSSTWERLASRG